VGRDRFQGYCPFGHCCGGWCGWHLRHKGVSIAARWRSTAAATASGCGLLGGHGEGEGEGAAVAKAGGEASGEGLEGSAVQHGQRARGKGLKGEKGADEKSEACEVRSEL